MTFDNGKTIIGLRLRALVSTVLFFIYLLLALFAKKIPFPIAGMDKTLFTLVVTLLYLLISFYPLLLKYRYIYFSTDGEAVIFRYYSVGMITQKKQSVEIAKRSFAGYKKGSILLGAIQYISLKQRMREGVALYPRIYITSLTKAEKEKVISALESELSNVT